MRYLGWAISVATLALVFTILWHISRAVYVSYSVERDYFYTVFVLRLVEEYVSKHGEWPQSWEDLEDLKRSKTSEWPKNSRRIQERVFIDFDTSLDELACESVEQFEAISPIDYNELFNDNDLRSAHVEPLLEEIRRVVSQRTQHSVPNAEEEQRTVPASR